MRAALEGSRRREGAISRGARPNPGAASFLHPISLITSITWSLHLGRHTTPYHTIPRSLHLGRSTPRAPQEAPHDSAQGGRTTTQRNTTCGNTTWGNTTWGNTTRRNTTQGNTIPHGAIQNREIPHGGISHVGIQEVGIQHRGTQQGRILVHLVALPHGDA